MEFRKICVACTNANGEPDILFFKFNTDDWEDEFHNDIKKIAVAEYDYEGPYVIWDETDYLFHNLDCESKFDWESANIHNRISSEDI